MTALAQLLERRRLSILGLNSGTSADGVDMAVLRISRTARGVKPTFVSGAFHKYPTELKKQIHEMCDTDSTTMDRLMYLHNALGDYFGAAAARMIRRTRKEGIVIDAVASHGQTIRHLPQKTEFLGKRHTATLQLGSLAYIAARTGRPAVGDFRQADIALGGEGAPITTGAMRDLFGDSRTPRLIVNIGGMSNYFFFPTDRNAEARAADCGPGNAVCDLLSQRLFKAPMDKNGLQASRGTVSERLLAILFAEPFFRGKVKSTGREAFGLQLVDRMLALAGQLSLSKHDLMATAAEFTTRSIAMAIWPVLCDDERVANLYLTGGGRKNRFFVKRLQHHLPDVTVQTIEELGYDGDLVEAAAYALMGEYCLRGIGAADGRVKRKRKELYPVRGIIAHPPQE